VLLHCAVRGVARVAPAAQPFAAVGRVLPPAVVAAVLNWMNLRENVG